MSQPNPPLAAGGQKILGTPCCPLFRVRFHCIILVLTTPLVIFDHTPSVIVSRAPIACMRCNKLRSSGFFKCGRCGDAYKAEPLVDPPWEQSHDARNVASPSSKRRRGSSDEQGQPQEIGKEYICEKLEG